MSFAGHAMFIAENIDTYLFLQDMNGEALKQYWLALENICVGKASSELNRSKFAIMVQERGETIPLYSAKRLALFNTAYPEEGNANSHILVIDKFINGLTNANHKRFVLQQKKQDDHLTALIDLALKFDSVTTLMTQNIESYGINKQNINEMQKRGYNRYNTNGEGKPRRYINYEKQANKPFYRNNKSSFSNSRPSYNYYRHKPCTPP